MTKQETFPVEAVAMSPEEFARIRKAARYTQHQLARKVLKCHPVHVSRLETGASPITPETAEKMKLLRYRARA